MQKNKSFFNLIKTKYNEFILKKFAQPQEILAYLAQLTKNHYQKINLKRQGLKDIKQSKLNIDYFKSSNKMFCAFYQSEQESFTISKSEYKKIINWLIETWNNIDVTNTNCSTNDILVQIIQSIAKNISPGPYIDLALGTGKLMENMPLTKIDARNPIPLGNRIYHRINDIDSYNYGFDIDPNSLYIADALLNYEEETPKVKINFDNYSQNNSIRNVYKNLRFKEWQNKYPVFMFDPPMGTKNIQENPANWKKENTYLKIFDNTNSNESSSDILFLMNYLINGQNNSYFIGLFPISVLNNSTQKYQNLRQYLIKNNLNYVITYDSSLLSRFVVLVGTKDKEKLNDNLEVINILNSHGIKELENIFNAKTNSEYKNILLTNIERKNFNNSFDITIPNKIKESNKEKEKLPAKILSSLILKNERELLKLSQSIYEYLLETDLPESDDINIEKKEDILWFNIAENIEQIPDAKKLNQIYNYTKYISNNSRQLILENIQDSNLKNIFSNLLYLYKQARFDPKTHIINFEQEITKKLKVRKDYFVRQFSPLYNKTGFIPFLQTNSIYKDLYETFCEYWILGENNIENFRKNYNKSQISLAIKVLVEVGLLKPIDSKEILKDDLYIYNSYRPLINFMEEK